MCDEIPPFLTVAEAGRLLRIGRTKAYELTQEWRDSGGRSGLPVIDFGDLLRVPGPAIEEMLHTGLPNTEVPGTPDGRTQGEPTGKTGNTGEAAPAAMPPRTNAPPEAGHDQEPPPSRTPKRPRRRDPISDQLPLFEPLPTASPNSQAPLPS